MAFLLRFLVFVLLARLVTYVLRALSAPGADHLRRAAPQDPPRPRTPRRPAGGDIVDAEFEDLGERKG
jgi:hypothetical protein